MRERLLVFAAEILKATRTFQTDHASRHVGQQLFRAATSVASNYRAATLARSRTEFVAKLGIVREEADEVVFWLEFIERAVPSRTRDQDFAAIRKEASEIVAIVSAAYRTSRERYGRWKP